MSLNRTFLKIHRLLGVFLAFNFFILGITGVLLLWKDSFEGKDNLSTPATFVANDYESIRKVEGYLQQKFPTKKTLAIFKGDDGLIHARVTSPNQSKFKGAIRLKFDKNGSPVVTDSQKGFLGYVLDFHRNLLLEGKGKFLIGLIGALGLFVILSGILIAPHIHRKMRFNSKRSFLGGLHKKIGINLFAWILIVTFTGTVLAFNDTIITLFIKSELQEKMKSSNPEALAISPKYVAAQDIINTLKKKKPELQYDFISFPDNEFSLPGKFVILVEKENEKLITFFDGKSGRFEKVVSLPWYIKLLIVSEPLHFGNYGGAFLKIIWSLFGILFSVIPLSGFLIYLNRKKKISLEKLLLLKNSKTIIPKDRLIITIAIPFFLILGSYFLSGTVQFLINIALISLFISSFFRPRQINQSEELKTRKLHAR